jgi:hypothetical protein
MEIRWLFTEFDWKRYHEVAPQLRAMQWPDHLDSLDGIEEFGSAEDVLDEFSDDARSEAVCNALLVELCTAGEGALFEGGLPELIKWLRRQAKGEDAADVLAELISAQQGVEEWFATGGGLVGLLTVEQTSELARSMAAFRKGYRPAKRARGLAGLTRRFRTSEPAIEHLEELFGVVDEAAAEMRGLGVIRVE